MENLTNVLRTLNPWWANKSINKENLIERTIKEELLQSFELRQIKDLLGVRRSGKTTLLYLTIEYLLKKGVPPQKIFFLSFDEINISTADFADIEKAIYQIELNPEYLFLDEAQEKRDWQRWVKKLYDLRMFKHIFISGSNATLLSHDVGKLLTGRHITTVIFPFSFNEFLLANNWNNFDINYLLSEKNKILHYLSKYLKNGGFPETIGKEDGFANRILTNTYNDIISRDIATRYSIQREKIDLLVKYLFTNIAKEYSNNKLANAVGINVDTIEKYLEYLKETFLIYSLDIFSYKLKVQYKQNKKIYCVDNGLRNFVSFRFSEDIGKLYENAVFIELKRRKKEVYYWKGNGEVDFLVKEGLKVKELIQVCQDISDKKTRKREVDGLVESAKLFKIKKGMIITEDCSDEMETNGIKIKFIPLWRWLLEE